ncbi:BID domain-containing T4SS effector [Bartonella phoceensis]|uniref:BID domain-containing T4SS effector n=1 Tax=Bartonella phoceensis TaxID=270249 RepID=UPI001ABBD100|nr:BID domain-containing T4SS effector [Bartonella phoceensis]
MPKVKSIKTSVSSVLISSHHDTYPRSYTYKDGVTLKNKYGIKDPKALAVKCSHDVEKAMNNLRSESPPVQLDSSYLRYIHLCLFENAFEWAGLTRNEHFPSANDTSATMRKTKKTGWKVPFETDNEIKKGLQKLDQALIEKNNLKYLTREKFINEAMEMFVSLEHIRPFLKGNRCAQGVFFEKLGQIAGHRLDFSLVTKERMNRARVALKQYDNSEPIRHILEDSSNPETICILKEFMHNMKDIGYDINNCVVMAAKEGETYMGTYREVGSESFALNMDGTYIVGKKDHLTPEQVKTLKTGDKFTFKIPTDKNFEKNLIPGEKLAPLTKRELFEMISENGSILVGQRQIQRFAKRVYRNPERLNEKILQVIKDPDLCESFADQIEQIPRSVARLAGIKICGLRSPARKKAEENISLLSFAIRNYKGIIEQAQQAPLQEHQEEQKRRACAIEMPSQDLQNVLSFPQEKQKEILANFPVLQQELGNLMCKLNNRLSPEEHQAAKNHDYVKLSKSIGISESKAKVIADIVRKTKQALRQPPMIKMNRIKSLIMAS